MEAFRLGHRKALDGIRGLAILLVMLCHIPSLPLQGGFIGVDLFFVLSGFLITTLLVEEWQETGRISLGAFYARRLLRLIPPLLVVLGVVLLYSELREDKRALSAMQKSALMTLFYVGNWFMAFGAYPRKELTATWSLSVEEQYYLVWPLLLIFLLRWAPRGVIVGVLIHLIVITAANRIAIHAFNASPDRIFFGTDTHADGLLAGSLAGLLFSWGALPKTPGGQRALQIAALLSLGLLGVLTGIGWHADAHMVRTGYLGLNLAAMLLILALVGTPTGLLHRLFEFAPLAWLGRISYGVYLWHMVTFWLVSGKMPWAALIGLTIAIAALSYYVLERPILKFKTRFEKANAGPPVSP